MLKSMEWANWIGFGFLYIFRKQTHTSGLACLMPFRKEQVAARSAGISSCFASQELAQLIAEGLAYSWSEGFADQLIPAEQTVCCRSYIFQRLEGAGKQD